MELPKKHVFTRHGAACGGANLLDLWAQLTSIVCHSWKGAQRPYPKIMHMANEACIAIYVCAWNAWTAAGSSDVGTFAAINFLRLSIKDLNGNLHRSCSSSRIQERMERNQSQESPQMLMLITLS